MKQVGWCVLTIKGSAFFHDEPAADEYAARWHGIKKPLYIEVDEP